MGDEDTLFTEEDYAEAFRLFMLNRKRYSSFEDSRAVWNKMNGGRLFWLMTAQARRIHKD